MYFSSHSQHEENRKHSELLWSSCIQIPLLSLSILLTKQTYFSIILSWFISFPKTQIFLTNVNVSRNLGSTYNLNKYTHHTNILSFILSWHLCVFLCIYSCFVFWSRFCITKHLPNSKFSLYHSSFANYASIISFNVLSTWALDIRCSLFLVYSTFCRQKSPYSDFQHKWNVSINL